MKEYPIVLPLPPSENSCWFNKAGKGRINTTAYKKWTKRALQELMIQKIPKFHGRKDILWGLGFTIFSFKKNRKGRPPDAPNFLKPMIDVISTYIGIDDNIHKHVHSDGYRPLLTDGLETLETILLIYEGDK